MTYALKPVHLVEALLPASHEAPVIEKGQMHGGSASLAFGRNANVYAVAAQTAEQDFDAAVAEAVDDYKVCSASSIMAQIRGQRMVGEPLVKRDQPDPIKELNRGPGVVAVVTASITTNGKTYTTKGVGYTPDSAGRPGLMGEEMAKQAAWAIAMRNLACKVGTDQGGAK